MHLADYTYSTRILHGGAFVVKLHRRARHGNQRGAGIHRIAPSGEFHKAVQDLHHAPNARLAYGIRQVAFLEVFLAFFRGQFTTMEQFAADEGAVLLFEAIHELSRLLVGQFRGAPVVSFASAVLGSDHQDAAGDCAADLFLATHASPKSAGHLQRGVLVKVKNITVGIEDRLRAVVALRELGDCGFGSVIHMIPLCSAFLLSCGNGGTNSRCGGRGCQAWMAAEAMQHHRLIALQIGRFKLFQQICEQQDKFL